LQDDPEEIHNLIDNPKYDAIEAQLNQTLDSLEVVYKVTEKELEHASKESVERAYKQFENLRGHTGTSYDPITNKDKKL
jgi:uncharacterized sulfatase